MFLCLQCISITVFIKYLAPVLCDLLIMIGIGRSFFSMLTSALVVGMVSACAEAACVRAAAALRYWIFLSLVHTFNVLGG